MALSEIAESADQLTELASEQPEEVPQDDNQLDSVRAEIEQERESSTGVTFSRLDPNRRSLSSPNILQPQAFQHQTSQPQTSLHDAIKRKLKRQLRPNSLVYFKIGANANNSTDLAPANQQNQTKTQTVNTKRRRTALGLISSASNRPISCAATSCAGSGGGGGGGGSGGWRNWFLSSSSSNAARSQQEPVKRVAAPECSQEERVLDLQAESSLAASSSCAHDAQELPAVSSNETREGSSWPVGRLAGPKRSAQVSNRLHSNQRIKTTLNVDPNGDLSSIVSICMGPDETDRKRLNNDGDQTKWQTSSATGPKTNVILIQRQISVAQQQTSSQTLTFNSSQANNNSLELLNDNLTGLKSSTASEMITTSSGGAAAASSPPVRPSLVDMLIDSQLDWRQLISEANEGQRLSDHLSALQIKRQEIIHELIQTERHHCLTLALMRQVYLVGLLKLNQQRQCNSQPADCFGQPNGQTNPGELSNQHQVSSTEPIDIERLFPALEELIQAHELFFAHLRLRLVECCSRDRLARHMPLVGIIGPLGDLLIDQFKLQPQLQSKINLQENKVDLIEGGLKARRHRPKSGRRHQRHQQMPRDASSCETSSRKPTNNTNGQKLLQAYAKFCGQHYESSRYFKQLMQHDKGFKQFIEHCNRQHAACRQRGIPECNLLVAQRLTKYPLLIEQLIKASKDEPNDEEEKLKRALGECRALLAELNSQLARKESFERLLDIYAQFSPKSYTIFNHKSAIKFTKHDLLQHKRLRQLLHVDDQVRIFNATRQKLFPVLCLILNDIVVFLRVEHNTNNNNNHNHQIGLPSQQVVLAGARAVGVAQLAPDVVQQQHQQAAASSLNYHSHSTGSANENFTQPMATSTSNNNNYHQPQHQQQQQQQVAYYFANIDNKSSVISLSNLIVREKAVVDPEPRSYLISNSLEQPEMYEVAFASRRHQTNFVEKLKSAIEQHIKHKLNTDHHHHHRSRLPTASSCCSLATSSTNTCSLSNSSAGSSVSSLVESCDSSSSSSSGRAPSSNTSSDNDHEEDEEERAAIEATDLSGQAKLTQQVAMLPLAIETGKTANSSNNNNNNSLKRANSMRRSKQLPPTQMASGGKLVGEKLDELTEDLDNFVLDIEQELLPEPARLSASSVSPSSELQNNANDDLTGQVLSDSAPFDGEKPNCELPSSQTNSPSPDEELPLVGSGLSGRARDSCDDLSSPRLYQTGGLNKVSKNHRRRRFQRPRQVSNQSSDSGATSGTSLTSGLGTTTGDEATPTASEISTDSGTKQSCNDRHEEDHDSGRGHDDSSSSSASCHDSMTLTRDKPVQTEETSDHQAALKQQQQLQVVVAGDGVKLPAVVATQLDKVVVVSEHSLGPTVEQANQETGSKRQFLKQQRKLSTVSTISNQKRLMQTLRSVGLLTGSHQSQHQNQPNQDQIVLCQNCSVKQFHKSQLEPNQMFGQQQSEQFCNSFVMATAKRHQQQLRRRSFFDPEQKLEEIRDSRIQLDKDKLEWREKFSRQQEQLLDERRELDLAREQLKREKVQVEIERQQLYRKLDILKENGILLSPSHKVIITGPNQMNPQQHYQSPSGPMSAQQPIQQQHQQALYAATFGNPLQQQQQQPVANGAKVPMHLSQESTQLGGQQMNAPSQFHQQRSSLIGVLPGASFLVRRFGGGGANCNPPAPAFFASNELAPLQSVPAQRQLDRAAL